MRWAPQLLEVACGTGARCRLDQLVQQLPHQPSCSASADLCWCSCLHVPVMLARAADTYAIVCLPNMVAAVSCAWGYTTTGGAKGVGESTTSAVVISLVLIFVFDFALSLLFFSGTGDSLRACM